jgi:riboflavin synthase alpha subunit
VDAYVNLEVDVLAKYVERLVGAYAGALPEGRGA